MKKLLSIFIVIAITIALTACNKESEKNTPPTVTDPTPPPTGIDDPSGNPVKMTLITSEGTKFYDGTNLWIWKYEVAKKAQSQVYSNTNMLYALDEYGETADYKLLMATPNIVKLTTPGMMLSLSGGVMKASVIIDLDAYNSWIVETIDKATAYAQGLLYRDHSRIWYNGVEYGDWKTRDYPLDNFVVVNGDVWARKATGAWVCVSDAAKINILYANSEFVIWNMDFDAHTGKINNIDVTWTKNWFDNAKEWLKSTTQNKWYGHKGHTWDGATLTESISAISDFAGKSNRFMIVGTHFEEGEDILYFIECDMGYLIRFVPSQNAYTQLVRLYIGDGQIETGVLMKQTLKPTIVEDDLYFIYDAQTYRYNFKNGLVALFGNNIAEVMEY